MITVGDGNRVYYQHTDGSMVMIGVVAPGADAGNIAVNQIVDRAEVLSRYEGAARRCKTSGVRRFAEEPTAAESWAD